MLAQEPPLSPLSRCLQLPPSCIKRKPDEAESELVAHDERVLFDAFNRLSPQTKAAMAACVDQVASLSEDEWQARREWWGAYRSAVGGSDLTVFFKAWLKYSPLPNGEPELPSQANPTGVPDSPGYFIERWDWLGNTQAGLALNGFDDEFRHWFVDFLDAHGRWIASRGSAVSVRRWIEYKGDPQHPFDINDYEVPPGGFTSFNAFFLRMVKQGTRPVSPVDMDDDYAVVAPSDGGIFFLSRSCGPDARVDLPSKRGDTLSLREAFPGFGESFIGGPILDTLLWFTDFHHFFAPVSGTVISMMDYPGSYNYDFDDFDPYHPDHLKPNKESDKSGWYKKLATHRRFVWIFKTPSIGLVAMAAIGFWGVGSIVVNDKDKSTWPKDPLTGAYLKPVQVGDKVTKGQYLGHFGYGASSIILAFQAQLNGRLLTFDFSAGGAEIDTAEEPAVQVKAKQHIGTARVHPLPQDSCWVQ